MPQENTFSVVVDALSTMASVSPPTGNGAIGLMYCPGRGEPSLPREQRAGRMQQDVASVRNWGAEALVTLMPEDELGRLGAGGLGELARNEGMLWLHLPITDMQAPDWHFEQQWLYAGSRLRALLRRGGRVMVHCRAGLGRSGTVAARLLVELGVPPAEAVAQVRHVRPGAIQTTAQEAYVMGLKRVSERGDAQFGRRLAGLLGGALGDALAYAHSGTRPGGDDRSLRQPILQQGQMQVSDDTQTSLFTLEGLIRGLRARTADDETLLKQMRLSWQDWMQTQGYRAKLSWHASHLLKHASLHARRKPGLTLLTALEKGAGGTQVKPINASQACGGLQRVGPIGLLANLETPRVFDLACQAAACTHGHPSAFLPAGALAALLAELSHGEPMRTALDKVQELLAAAPRHADTLEALRLALHKNSQVHFGRSARGLPPPLSGPGALAVGIYACLAGRDLHEALHLASDPEHGSDSAAAIAGQLYGAWRGIEALPHDWTVSLDIFDALLDLTQWAGPLLRRGI